MPYTSFSNICKNARQAKEEARLTAEAAVASNDYPELERILAERPPPESEGKRREAAQQGLCSLCNQEPATQTVAGSDVGERCAQHLLGEASSSPVAPPGFGEAVYGGLRATAAQNGSEVTAKEAGFFDFLDRHIPDRLKTPSGAGWSFDWCRYRHNSHCMYPSRLDATGSAQAGYPVWVPQDRGTCLRVNWKEQQSCPIGEPGPNSGSPRAMTDATVPWSQGGQRGGRPGDEAPRLAPYHANQYWIQPSLPEPVEEQGLKCPYCYGKGTGGRAAVTWNGDKCGKCDGLGRIDMRMKVGVLQSQGQKEDADFKFHFTSSWADVRKKAAQIRTEGNVRIVSSPEGINPYIMAEVKGTTATYQTTLMRTMGGKSVAAWECGCAWGSYAWGRTGRWKKFEGRMCSHALATMYQAQADEMFGGHIKEVEKRPVHFEDITWHNRNASKTASQNFSEEPPIMTEAMAMLEQGVDRDAVWDYVKTSGVSNPEGRWTAAITEPFRAKDPHDEVHTIVEIHGNQAITDIGESIHTDNLTHPQYDTKSGLEPGPKDSPMHSPEDGSEWAEDRLAQVASMHRKMAKDAADSNGVMVALVPPMSVTSDLAVNNGEPIDNLHTTVAYLGHAEDVDYDKLHAAAQAFASVTPPIQAKVSGFGNFETDDGHVHVALVDIPGIDRFRTGLMSFLSGAGIPVYDTHGVQPHLTLKYADQPMEYDQMPDAGAKFRLGHITVAHGGEWVDYPLEGKGDLARAASLDYDDEYESYDARGSSRENYRGGDSSRFQTGVGDMQSLSSGSYPSIQTEASFKVTADDRDRGGETIAPHHSPGGSYNSRATEMSGLHPDLQKKINDQFEKTSPGLTHEAMVNNIMAVHRHAQMHNQDALKHGMTWYNDAHNEAKALAEKHGTTLRHASGVLAAESPRSHWDHENKPVADYIMGKVGPNATKQGKTLDIDDKQKQQAFGYASGEYAKAKDAHAAKLAKHVSDPKKYKHPGEEPQPPKSLTPGKKYSEMGHQEAADSIYNQGKHDDLRVPEHAPDARTNKGKGDLRKVAFSSGSDNHVKAVRIARGEEPGDVLGGHKVRSFHNNIMDPNNEHGHNDVTIDTHAMGLAANSADKDKNIKLLAGTSSKKDNTDGSHAKVADAYREAHARLKATGEMSHDSHPLHLQAQTWEHWRGMADADKRGFKGIEHKAGIPNGWKPGVHKTGMATQMTRWASKTKNYRIDPYGGPREDPDLYPRNKDGHYDYGYDTELDDDDDDLISNSSQRISPTGMLRWGSQGFNSRWAAVSDEANNAAGKTQISRGQSVSAPTRMLVAKGLIKGNTLHHGAGSAQADTQHMKDGGAQVTEYEPNPPSHLSHEQRAQMADKSSLQKQYDTVVSNYVLNVVPPQHRQPVIRDIARSVHPHNGTGYVTVRGSGDKSIKGTPHGDGVITGRGTFQKGYKPEDLHSELSQHFKHVKLINGGKGNPSSITAEVSHRPQMKTSMTRWANASVEEAQQTRKKLEEEADRAEDDFNFNHVHNGVEPSDGKVQPVYRSSMPHGAAMVHWADNTNHEHAFRGVAGGVQTCSGCGLQWDPHKKTARYITIDEAREAGRSARGLQIQEELHDQPEPALPATDGNSPSAQWQQQHGPGAQDPMSVTQAPVSQPGEVGPSHVQTPDEALLEPGKALGESSIGDLEDAMYSRDHTSALVADPNDPNLPFDPNTGMPRPTWLHGGGSSSLGATEAAQADTMDIAAMAKKVLETGEIPKESSKTFTPSEQQELIREGSDVRATNLDRLEIADTHYAAIQAEEDEDLSWLM